MCGRFFLRPDLDEILRVFDASVDDVDDLRSPRWNVAPTQQVLGVVDEDGRRLGWYRWGLVPSWWKDADKLPTFLNARAETAAGKPSFRSAWKKRRVLVPASGFYEWHRTDDGKTPYAVTTAEPLVAFAGLWETWRRGEAPVRSLTLLTNDARGAVAAIHDRQPVALARDAWDAWLADDTDADTLASLVTPRDPGWITTEVGDGVNNARHSDGAWMPEALTA